MDERLKLPGGQINVSSDELNLMPESTRDFVHSFFSILFQNVTHIVQGCNVNVDNTTGELTITEGYIYIGTTNTTNEKPTGEILKVDAQTVEDSVASGIFIFQLQKTNNSTEGSRDFRDGNTKNVYETRRAIVVNVPSLPNIFSTNVTDESRRYSTVRLPNWNDEGLVDRIVNRPYVLSGGIGIKAHISSNGASFTVRERQNSDYAEGATVDLRIWYIDSTTGNVETQNEDNYVLTSLVGASGPVGITVPGIIIRVGCETPFGYVTI